MPSFLLDKTITFENEIQKVDSVIIDDHFTYVTLFEGIRVQGAIDISGLGHYENEQFPFSDSVDVDILCPNDQICSARGFALRVEDSTYEIGDHAIIFHIKCVLEGSEKIDEAFSLEEASKNAYLELEEAPLEIAFNSARSLLSKEDAAKLEQLMQEENVDVISTMDTSSFNGGTIDFIKDEEVPLSSAIIMKSEDDSEDENAQCVKKEMEPKAETAKQKWFRDEPMVVLSSYYRVKRGDTYQSIAAHHQLNEEQLFLQNKGQELKEGMLLRIRR